MVAVVVVTIAIIAVVIVVTMVAVTAVMTPPMAIVAVMIAVAVAILRGVVAVIAVAMLIVAVLRHERPWHQGDEQQQSSKNFQYSHIVSILPIQSRVAYPLRCNPEFLGRGQSR